jgi:hypothetical protein
MSSSAPRLTHRLLGAPDVQVAGLPLALNNQKARALLYYLAATGRPRTRDHLAALLWSEFSDYGVTHHVARSSHKVTLNDPKITPKLVIYDPQLTLDLPPALTAASGINALAHCVEAMYSITRHLLSTVAALRF